MALILNHKEFFVTEAGKKSKMSILNPAEMSSTVNTDKMFIRLLLGLFKSFLTSAKSPYINLTYLSAIQISIPLQ